MSVTPFEPVTAGKIVAVTKSDSTTYSPPLDALWCNETGTVTVVDGSGTSGVFEIGVAGQVIPVRIAKVMSTGTDGTNFTGLRY